MSEILDNIYILVLTINCEILLLVAFVKYTFSQFILGLFANCRNLLWGKILLKLFLYLCTYFVQKTTEMVLKDFRNAGIINCRKIPERLLNCTFNVLSISVKYTLSF